MDGTQELRCKMVRAKAETTEVSLALRGLRHIRCLRPLLAFGDLELYLITFLQAFIAFGADGAVVNKNIRSICAADKTVSLSVVEPLYGSFQTFHESPHFPHVLKGAKDVPAVIGCILRP
jgi:hypothetical protein